MSLDNITIHFKSNIYANLTLNKTVRVFFLEYVKPMAVSACKAAAAYRPDFTVSAFSAPRAITLS